MSFIKEVWSQIGQMLPWQHLCQQLSCTGTRLLKVYDGTAGHTRRVDWKGWLRWRSGRGGNQEIPLLERKRESVNHSAMSDSLLSHGLMPSRLLCRGFSRQEYWSGLSFPSPGNLPNPGLNPGLLHCRQILYHLSQQGSPERKCRE